MSFRSYILQEATFSYSATKYLDRVLDKIKKGDPMKLGADGKEQTTIVYTPDLERIHTQGATRLSTAEGIEFIDTDGNKYRYTQLFKGDFTTGGSGGGATKTKLVECAQCAYLAMMVHGYEPTAENISNVKEYFQVDETIANMKELEDSWVQSSIWGAQKLAEKLAKVGLSQMVFHRGSAAVSAIESRFGVLNKLAGKPFSDVNKFTPADIWLVNPKLNIASDMRKLTSLEDMRNYMMSHFKDGSLIGVSLKKIDKERVPWEIYNDGEAVSAKYMSTKISKDGKLFKDSIDIYMMFKYKNLTKAQFRAFSGKETGWQGEVKGLTSAGGKIGGGIVRRNTKLYLSQEMSNPGDITKKVRKIDDDFIDRFWFLIKDSGAYDMSEEEYRKKVRKADIKYLYSKFLSLELAHILKNSTQAQCDKFVRETIGYALSNTTDSAIFIKLGK